MINNRARDNFNGYGFIKCNFSRFNNNQKLGCRRSDRRYFCSKENVITKVLDLFQDNIDFSKYKEIANENHKEIPIITKDLDKEIVAYSSKKSIIEKLSTFKIDKCGKYIDITKEFLSDSLFLKFAYYMIRNSKGEHEQLDGINNT